MQRQNSRPPCSAGDTSDFANFGIVNAEGNSFQQDVRVIRRTQPNWLVFGGLEMVFDKFKGWRKAEAGPTIQCPLCQTHNPEEATECSQCMYQLGKAAFEQVASVDEEEAGSLFDELLAGQATHQISQILESLLLKNIVSNRT